MDECVARIIPELLELDGKAIVTADHGNCEQMRNSDGSPNTAHTSYLVHFVYVAKDAARIPVRRRNSCRCRADAFVFARAAATKGDDRAQFARAAFPRNPADHNCRARPHARHRLIYKIENAR